MKCLDIILSFNKDMDCFKQLVNDELNNIYLSGPLLLKEPINYIIRGGKRLRPSLCLLICNAFNKNVSKALVPAVSIELLHLFSLIHDDIMDNDDIRHNQLTLHKKWNISVAILAGDAILALAFKRLNNTENSIKELFNSALIAVCEGQALDIEYEGLKNISNKEYFKMIDLKTGFLIGLSAQMGATVANVADEISLAIRDYGRLLGRAFQMQDDCLEIFSNSENMGKSLESDILLGKKTFLMIQALERM